MGDAATRAAGRHYGMDWLRIGTFALLILFHVALVFSSFPYEIKSRHTYDWMSVPVLALNAWRLSLLFAISGFASAALFARERRPGSFLRNRMLRLGVPLLFAMIVVVPPQPWVALVTNHNYPDGFWHFLLHDYFSFRTIDGIMVPSWMHMWFVAYLMAYTAVLTALLKLPESWRAAASRQAEFLLAGPGLLPLPILYTIAVRQLPPGWNEWHDFLHDGATHASYGAMFLFGWLLRGSEPLRAAIARQWRLAAVLALGGFAIVMAMEFRYPGSDAMPADLLVPFHSARVAQGWGTIIALFGIADRYWNRDHRWRPMLVEAVFPFYIIHQTIILLGGYWLYPLALPAWVEFSVLTLATAAGCWLFYLVGREIGPLRPLIGLRRKKTARAG